MARLVLALIAVVCAPPIGRAQDAAIEEAREAIRDGDPVRAIEVLERAQETSTDPEIERELAIAHEMLGHEAEAADHLAAFLDAGTELEEDERAELAAHLAELRAPRSRPARGDDALEIAGWAQLGAGIGGLMLFLIGGVVSATLENALPEDCRMDATLCRPGARAGVDDAWAIATIGIGPGVILTVLGAIDLALAGADQGGASRSLPPDLDPTVQRAFTLAPWVGRDAAGVRVRLSW